MMIHVLDETRLTQTSIQRNAFGERVHLDPSLFRFCAGVTPERSHSIATMRWKSDSRAVTIATTDTCSERISTAMIVRRSRIWASRPACWSVVETLA